MIQVLNKFKLLLLLIIIFLLGSIVTLEIIDYKNINDVSLIEKEQITNQIIQFNGINDAVSKVYNSVFTVMTYKNNNLIGTGSGFFYKIENNVAYLITNEHVVNSGDKVVIELYDGTILNTNILGTDIYMDLAVLSTEYNDKIEIATLGDTNKLKLGDMLFTVGSPMGYKGSITVGYVSSLNRLVDIENNNETFVMNLIQTDAAINPGNSGGALVNLNGEVIGINSLKFAASEIEGMGFAIPITDALRYVNTLETGNKIIRPAFGVKISNAKNIKELNTDIGVYVNETIENQTADIYSIKKGSIITKINDDIVNDVKTFRYLLFKYSIGDTITVTYIYEGETLEKEIILENSI